MSEIDSSFFEKIAVLNYLNEEIKRNIKLLHVFRDILNQINVILVTNEDEVYCCGYNSRGVLGFGHNNSIKEFTYNEILSNKQIIDFKNSLYHTIARDSDGKLYCWGINRYLGNGREDKEISKPELHEFLKNENIIDMCCGVCHTLVLISNNEVYAWGWNYWGQIGNRGDGNVMFIPFRVNELNEKKVKAISCGSNHSMALTEGGCVYSWGNNKWGQLGLNSRNEHENKPKRIQIEVKIEKISCGREHSLLLSCERDIYVFGCNDCFQLGLITNEEFQFTPIKLNHSEKFIEIASHYNYDISAALSENGLYYVWGDCGKHGILSEPIEVQEFNSFHEIFLHILEITLKSIKYLFHIQNNLPNGKYTRNWTEITKIGSGSHGTVFKVKNNIIEKTNFAIKEIPMKEENNSMKELINSQLILGLNSDSLVRYYDVWYENDFKLIDGLREYSENKYTIYIQMDLCDKTLSEFNEEIRKTPELYLNNSLTLLGYYLLSELSIEILKGVKYLHDNKIIHRDLNPDNILLKSETNGNCIKIGDFGLAKVYDKNILHTQDRGNLRYAAPEVLDSRNYDTRADIYSLEVILQKNFYINVNSEYMNNGNQISLLMFKYKNLRDLSIEMKNEVFRKRPNCEQILDRKEEWTINESEFNFEEELQLGISSDNKSYAQSIIFSKLSFFLNMKQNLEGVD